MIRMKITHIAILARDIEMLKDFYRRWFGATAGPRYHNPRRDISV